MPDWLRQWYKDVFDLSDAQLDELEAARAAEKKAAKREAAIWDAMSDGAIVVAGGCAVGALGSGPFGAIVLGTCAGVVTVGSGLWALISDYYSWLADDPPRDDFYVVSTFRRLEYDLEPPTHESSAAFQELAKLSVDMTGALKALVESYERHDGVILAMKQSAPTSESLQELRRHHMAQVEAISTNASACADLGQDLLALRPKVNETWQQVQAAIPPGAARSADAQGRAMEVWQASAGTLKDKFRISDADFELINQKVSQAGGGQKQMPEMPKVLLDDAWKEGTESMAADHRRVAEAYARLKESLPPLPEGNAAKPDPKH